MDVVAALAGVFEAPVTHFYDIDPTDALINALRILEAADADAILFAPETAQFSGAVDSLAASIRNTTPPIKRFRARRAAKGDRDGCPQPQEVLNRLKRRSADRLPAACRWRSVVHSSPPAPPGVPR